MKLAEIALPNQKLTREEQLQVVSMVLETSNYTIAEAKTNQTIREEVKLNLEFYTEVKKGFVNEAGGVLGTILSVLGNIKDFLTGAKVVKDIVAFIRGIIEKIGEKLKPLVEKYIPSNLQNAVKATGEAIAFEIEMFKAFSQWLYKTLSAAGLAKLFAMIRYKTLRPSEEQKKCMLAAATAVYRAVLIILVVAFLVKLGMALFAVATAKGIAGAALSSGIQKAGFVGLKPIFVKLGGGSAYKGLFSAFSAGVKAKDTNKLKGQLDAIKKDETEGGVFDKVNAYWNECPIS
jgi:polyhydroxyalkanoate synthesis regulator protein